MMNFNSTKIDNCLFRHGNIGSEQLSQTIINQTELLETKDDDIYNPFSSNYIWKYTGVVKQIRKVFVPINNNGDRQEFLQFTPSQLKNNYLQKLAYSINLDWFDLNKDIWVIVNSIFKISN